VSRRVLIVLLAAGVLAAPSAGANRTQLAPGIVYDKQVQLTGHGAVVTHVVTAPRPIGNYRLRTVLSNNAVSGREPLTAIERAIAPSVTNLVGVNGDFFFADGRPNGIVIRDGALDYAPLAARSSLGIDVRGNLRVDRVELFATWQGTGPRRALVGINRPPGKAGVTVYTPAWGAVTPPASDTVEVPVTGVGATVPNRELTGQAAAAKPGGGTPIPAGGAVLVGRGAGGGSLTSEARGQVTLRLLLNPDWSGVVDAIGGGPLLVRDGKPIFRSRESISSLTLSLRQARAAIGQKADGSLLFVVVDGGRYGYSTGMTSYELARTLARLGAVTAFALAPGSTSVLASDGRLLNRPSDRRLGERALADALVLTYSGPK
jgi:hypothetical protein